MKKEFKITAVMDSHSGLLSRVLLILSRRRIGIDNLNVSLSEEGQYKLTVGVSTDILAMQKLAKQVEKQVGVFSVSYSADTKQL